MATHPGKKLLFMGQEFGQFTEWNEKKELDWVLLTYPMHQGLQNYVSDLNKIYLKNSELYEIEDSWDGFTWVELGGSNGALFSFIRRNKAGRELVVVINFSGEAFDSYDLYNDSFKGRYKVIIDSDSHYYGGENKYHYEEIKADKNKLTIAINKLSVLILKKMK